MAATQAEPPVPESSGGPPEMEQAPPPPGLQNGEKQTNNKLSPAPTGPELNVGPKGKMQNNVGMDPMSQYQQRGGGGEPPVGMNNNNNESPGGQHNSDEPPESKMYPPQQGEGGAPMGGGHPYPGGGGGGGPNYPHPGGPRGNYHHPGSSEMEHMSQMRHAGGYKPMPPRGAMGGGYPQQRFISGQSISQPTGPTPTLNQLLQSSNPGAHRFQNRYGPGEPYAQNWPPPRGPYPAQPGPGPNMGPSQGGPGPAMGPGPTMGTNPNMGPNPTMSPGPTMGPSAAMGPNPNMGNSPSMGPGGYRSQQPPRPPYNTSAPEPPSPGSPGQGYPQRYPGPPSRQAYPYPSPSQPGGSYDPQQRQWSQAPHPPQSQSPQAPSPQSPRPNQPATPTPHSSEPGGDSERPIPSPTRSVSPAVRPPYSYQGAPGSQYQQPYHMQHPGFPGGYYPSPHHSMGPPLMPPAQHDPLHAPHMHSDSSSDSGTLDQGRHDNGYTGSSLVTTGPDGAGVDEASQQSTLSNASAASGEEPVCPPAAKRRDMGPGMMGGMGWGGRHPPGTAAMPHSPGGGPAPTGMGPLEEFTPTPPPAQAAPTPSWPRAHSSHKHDSLSKLFDMDDTVERRHFLEKLLGFMEERGSPISTCPTISKNLLDLFRLYLFVKERGGFLEVCRVNKNKIWKDIAGLLNIGASSSAAYTLRKHYIKNILPFECHFDRGGVDPQPIINQVEASTKKKSAKAAAPTVPSPGSSNSQDSFPSSAGGSMDGYGGYGYPPDFNNQRPPTQPPHPQGYQGQGYPQYPDQYNQQYPPPPNRSVYPYPGPESERGYPQAGAPGGPPTPGMPPGGQPTTPDYRGGPYTQPGYAPSPRGAYPGPGGVSQAPATPTPPTQATPPPSTGAAPGAQDYFRQDAPRRHPDFAKDAQPPSPQTAPTRPLYPGPGWAASQNSNYRGPGPTYPPPQQQWNQCPPRPPSAPQWGDQSRGYPPSPNTAAQPQAWPQSPVRMMRPPADPAKPFPPLPPTPGLKPQAPPAAAVKREIQFPPDSVEAVAPVMLKRRKLGRQDVAPVEAWRLMMALKSGLLAETCWAIDVLNILLFDDTGVAYFGLAHLPGLLDILLEHFKKSLSDMLEPEGGSTPRRKWYEPPPVDTAEPDLGIPDALAPPPLDKHLMVVTKSKRNFESRKKAVVTAAREDLFVRDGPRAWERFPYDTEEPGSDTGYIIPTFRAEYGSVPFVRILDPKPDRETSSKPNAPVHSDVKTVKKEVEPATAVVQPDENLDVKIKEKPAVVADVKTEDEKTEEKPPSSDAKEEEVKEEKKFEVKIVDPVGQKPRRLSDYEDESYSRDEASLYPVSDSQDNIARRCIALSNILRNLTFVPGNELEFSKSGTFLRLLGRLILAYHEHGLRVTKSRNYDRDEENDWTDCCSSLSPQAETEWWWDYMENIRENVLVSLANIAGHIDLDLYGEDITRPLLDGLLHWAVCPAAQGQDPFPSSACNLSPQRLALEALCKLCVTDNNVDLVIATPPYARLERLTYVLTRFLCKNEDQVLREFGVNLLHYLAAADSAMSRTIALQSPCISLLVAFIEQAEQNALGVANQHGIGALRDNPDSMGTSLDMLRRTARTLLHLSRHPDNRPLFIEQEARLLALVMSQILDQQVAAIISRVLYQTRPDLYGHR